MINFFTIQNHYAYIHYKFVIKTNTSNFDLICVYSFVDAFKVNMSW